MMLNGIRIRSAVFPQCTGQPDRRTHIRTYDRPTDRPRESLTTTGRCAPRATRPKTSMIKCILHNQAGLISGLFGVTFLIKQNKRSFAESMTLVRAACEVFHLATASKSSFVVWNSCLQLMVDTLNILFAGMEPANEPHSREDRPNTPVLRPVSPSLP